MQGPHAENDAKLVDIMAEAGDLDAKKEQLRRPVKVGDIVPYNGQHRRVVAVGEDGVTVTVGTINVPDPAAPAPEVRPNRASRRAAAAGARAAAKAKARMLRRIR